MGYLLDTNILSESSRLHTNEKVLTWLDAHDHESYLSTISLGEIVKGLELLPKGKRRQELEQWFIRLQKWVEPRLLAPNTEVMHEWGRLCARHELKGRRLPVLDSLIAATAISHDLVLVTRNTADYPSEVKLLNPWDD
jgi:predicted nucleic acid-binding protein